MTAKGKTPRGLAWPPAGCWCLGKKPKVPRPQTEPDSAGIGACSSDGPDIAASQCEA